MCSLFGYECKMASKLVRVARNQIYVQFDDLFEIIFKVFIFFFSQEAAEK